MNTLKQQQPPTPSIESGFTLIECLIAIIIVGVLMVAIAPAVVLATATRLQARRVELATQSARTYVDGVRSGSIATPNFIQVLNEVNLTNPSDAKFDPKRDLFSQVPAPFAVSITSCPDRQASGTSSASDYCFNNSTGPSTSYFSLYCINFDGNGCANNRSSKNMIVQAFRSSTPSPTNPTSPNPSDNGSQGYILGVRVYRLDAFDGSGVPLKKTQQTNRRTATYTAGVGDNKAPLVELTTEIAPTATAQSDPSGRWKSLCSRLGGCTSPTPATSPIP